MARDADTGSGASGRNALAIFRDDDWDSFVAAVMDLPTIARDRGVDVAIALMRIEIASLLDLLDLVDARGTTQLMAKEAVGLFLETGSLRLMADGDRAGFQYRVAFLGVVRREIFRPSVRAVFERSAPSATNPYVPQIPTARER